MKKKWIGIIASILTVCMLTMGAFAATTTVTISKGQGSKVSSKLSGHGANFSAANYSSSTEIMQAYGMAGRAIKWSPSIKNRKKASGSWSDSQNTYSFQMQLVGSYGCNGSGTMTVS